MPRWRGRWGTNRGAAGLLALGVALPVLVLLVKVVAGLPARVEVAGDPAVTELYTLRAIGGHQLLGPYSRFGFHHPGPLVFYALAPFYLLLGRSYAALCVGALVINLASLVGIGVVLWRVAGPARWFWSCAAIASFVVFLRPDVLISAWNPNIAVLPFAFALVALVAVMAGFTEYLPVAAVAGSFAVQSHLTCAAPVACAALMAALALVLRHRGRRGGLAQEQSPVARHVMISALLVSVLWMAPLVEQIRNSPGNVTLILRFVRESHERQPLGQSLSALASQASGFLLAPLGVNTEATPPAALTRILGVFSGTQLLLLIVGLGRGWVRRDAFVVAACATAACLLSVALFVTLGLSGPLWPYLVRWVSAVGLLGWLAVAAAFTGVGSEPLRRPRIQMIVCAVLVGSMAVIGLRDVGRLAGLRQYIASAWPDRLSAATISALAGRGIRRPHLRILRNRSWEQAAGLVLQCTKAGGHISVDPNWLFMFGQEYGLSEPDDGAVLVAPSELAAQIAGTCGTEVLASSGEDTALLAASDQRPVPQIQMGTLCAEVYLRGGFSGPEPEVAGGFRWSDGPSSWVQLPASTGRPQVLRFLACPIRVAGAQETITVELNGMPLATAAMQPNWTAYSIAVPGDASRSQNLIGFRYSYVRSPHGITGAGDRRQLAVRFRWISLSEMRPN
jgi:hypothetical protein